jgi:hypothetical protein
LFVSVSSTLIVLHFHGKSSSTLWEGIWCKYIPKNPSYGGDQLT